jgi:hypothetical protein
MTRPTPCLRRLPVVAAALGAAWTFAAFAPAQAFAQQELLAESAHELPAQQDAFWSSILELCGQAFERVDALYVMHVRQCYPDEIRIPVHVGNAEDGTWNRSRTWILTRTPDGIRLKHDHRNPDGTEETVTQYGGDTGEPGTPGIQTFPADEFTREVVAAEVRGAENNIWRMEITPGVTFSYRLTRSTFDNALRWAFDLRTPVAAPPAPWGYEDTEPTHGVTHGG